MRKKLNEGGSEDSWYPGHQEFLEGLKPQYKSLLKNVDKNSD